MSRRFVRFLLVAVVIPACSDPLSPSDVSGLYVLSRVNDEALPRFWNEWTDGNGEHTLRILADTIRLSSEGTAMWGSRVFDHSIERDGGTQTLPLLWEPEEFRFSLSDNQIHFAYVDSCTMCFMIIHGWTARLTSDGFELRDVYNFDPRKYRFRRVQ